MERPTRHLGNDARSRLDRITTTEAKVDETISQDHTDSQREDPLARKDAEESKLYSELMEQRRRKSTIAFGPDDVAYKRHLREMLPTNLRPEHEDPEHEDPEHEDPEHEDPEHEDPEHEDPEYETPRAIPGLEFRKDDCCRAVDSLLATIARLKVENDTLKKEINNVSVSMATSQRSDIGGHDHANYDVRANATKTPRYEVFHQVNCHHAHYYLAPKYFRDAPRLFQGDTVENHLRGRVQIPDLANHFEEHAGVAFIVNLVHSCEHRDTNGSGSRHDRLIADSKPPQSVATNILIRPSLLLAIKTAMDHYPDHFEGFDSARMTDKFREPFMFFYIYSKTLVQLSESSGLEACDCEAIQLLHSYFEEKWRGDWDEADRLFSRGKVNKKHFDKLFRPGELMLIKSEDGQEILTAKQIANYPWGESRTSAVPITEWQFNGQFKKTHSYYSEKIDGDTDIDIASHPYPLRLSHDAALVEDQLVSRGLKFWRYRKPTLVCYMDQKNNEESQAERRFMIDYEVFRRMHPKNEIFDEIVDDLGQETMGRDQPPSGAFLACLPAHIHGYDLSDKTWKLIRVDRTTDVTWNKNIFKRLVLPSHNKELIQAVVTAHGQQMSGTADIVGGKGQGVLLLLHGGPGTGKTLTAEGIAEEQERPLYRVTCGDIGVEPDEVEKYLKYVLEIGRAWGCVVLLDEADVFLEERSLADYKRNAIISIFLRVLEYYDGILILTTNRVGRFDEAFKSRIHLSLGYPNLNEEQREQIWRNFFHLLDRNKERFDIQDLELNVHKLAKHEINGRQIRNTVMMARHLAKFRKQALVYKHVQEAVAAVVKFNEYLQSVKGASDDDFAEYDRLRARIA